MLSSLRTGWLAGSTNVQMQCVGAVNWEKPLAPSWLQSRVGSGRSNLLNVTKSRVKYAVFSDGKSQSSFTLRVISISDIGFAVVNTL